MSLRRSLFAIGVLAGLMAGAYGVRGMLAGPPSPSIHETDTPELLSDWGVVGVRGGHLALGRGVVPYDLATALFSDYAGKLRTIWLPPGTSAKYDATETFDFPVGTVITKTFYYPRAEGEPATGARVYPAIGERLQHGADGLDLRQIRLMETRVLVRRASGWVALPYIWNAEQTEAHLQKIGGRADLELVRDDGTTQRFVYAVPNANQCASCHTPNHASRQISPIGPKARHLNHDFAYVEGTENQLSHLVRLGLLTGAPDPAAAPRNASIYDTTASLDARARAYLDINCGHCHSANGLARTTGLHLDANNTDPTHLGFCKPPVAAGPGTGDNNYDIVPGHPEISILTYRLGSDRPGVRMPELGRNLVHREGVALITQWIQSLQGNCKT